MSGQALIAVTAAACRFPGASDVDAFWDLLRAGREGLRRFTEAELVARGVPARLRGHRDYVPVGGLIDDQDQFDPQPFGLTDAEAALMDPQQRLFLECSWQALERAGHGGGVGVESVGVFAGAMHSSYLASNLAGRWDPTGGGADPIASLQTAISTQADYLPLQVAYRLDLTGPALSINTTCSTSLVAVHAAVQALLAGECDMALAGGVSLIVPQGHGYRYVPEGIFSVDGHVRPFSAVGTGIVYSQGVGAVVLRPLDEALADGDPVLAVLYGSAVNNDGADKAGFTAPSVRGQAKVIAEALAVAGLDPRQVGYVEAHGTGTRLGDPIETAALRLAFGDQGPAWCGLGSVKSNIGHTNSAAGIASFIKTVLAVHHAVLPASLHAHPVNEHLALDGSPFEVVTETRPWDTPRRAGVSSFGIGGTNVHVLLGPAPTRPAPVADPRPQVLVWSAHSRAALDAAARPPEADPDDRLADLAYTLQTGREHFPHRVAAVVTDGGPVRLGAAAVGSASPQVVFVFPGGGSQYAGMGSSLCEAEPAFRDCVDECAELFLPQLGVDVRSMIRFADPAAVAAAESAASGLPALFTVSVAAARLLMSWGVRPDVLLGHSLGEYAAAVTSGALPLADAVRLVAVRSVAMGQAAGGGVMLVVPLGETEVAEILDRHPQVDLAVVNAPQACVVSGPAVAVAALEGDLGACGVETTRLRLDSAAHSRMIEPALDTMRAAAKGLPARAPGIRVISSTTAAEVGAEFGDAEHWVRQLREPVRFSGALAAAFAGPGAGPVVLVQVGPGAALAALARGQGPPQLTATVTTFATQDGESDLVAARSALGQLWTRGVAVDFTALHRPGRRRVLAPGYAFQRRRLWIDPEPVSAGFGGPQPDDTNPLQVPVWHQQPPPADDVGVVGRWLVAGPPGALRDSVAHAMIATGAAVVALGDEAPEESAPFAGVVVLVGEGGHADRDGPGAQGVGPQGVGPQAAGPQAAQRAILDHARLAAVLSALNHPPGVLLQVTLGACRVQSTDRPAPAVAAARALPRVIAQESPGLVWRTLDVLAADEAGPAVVAELGELLGPDPRLGAELAVRGNTRWLRTLAPWQLAPASAPQPGGRPTALIIGGLGDVGLTMAAHLAGQGMRVVVTSRSGVPVDPAPNSGEAGRAASLRLIAQRGLDVSVRVLDCADDDATRGLLRDLTLDSPVDLVVHAAGVVASADLRPMRAVAAEQVAGHLRAKASGALALRAAIDALPERSRPRVVVLMSSAGTLVGGIGMGPYSASNGFLDGLAEQVAIEAGPRWVSVVWDAWKVGPLGTEREVNLDFALDAATGMAALDSILGACRAGTAPPVVAVSTTDLRVRMRDAARRLSPSTAAEGAEEGELSPVEAVVARMWSELFGVPVRSAVAEFFSLGGHSLLATRMLVALRERYGAALSLRDLLAHPTVGGLAELVTTRGSAPASPAPAPVVQRRVTDQDGTFDMTRVQHAYWVGRDGGYALGETACHFFLEYDCPELDLARYEDAWNRVIARHPMLRAIATRQGRLAVLDHVPRYRIRTVDLTEATEERRAQRLATLRERISRHPGPSDRWPLVQLQAARLPGARVRLFLGVDVLICDAGSYWIVDREVRHFYEHPDVELPEVGVSFADCVAALAARPGTPAWERSAGYWRTRMAKLPPAPALPVTSSSEGGRFVRRTARLDRREWAALQAGAARCGVTATAALLSAYAEALANWTGSRRFCLTLTLFDRPAIHPDVDSVVGDFTSLLLHEVDRSAPGSFAEHAARTQRTLFADLDHREFSALEVLAERSASTGVVESVPVVFTSALGLGDVIGGEHDLQWVGEQVYALSQTPQTWLDHQVLVQRGELLVQWDALEPVLPAAETDRAFERYTARLRRLAADPDTWDVPVQPQAPVPAPVSAPVPVLVEDMVEDMAVTLREGSGDQTVFLIHPSGGDVVCYADLARQLDERVTVVGITDPGLAGAPVATDLGDVAHTYVELLRRLRPRGPYLLGGWSMGGSLSQEIACVLHEQGEHVALLVLLDSNDPTYITAIEGSAEEVEGETIVRHLGALEAYLGIDLGVGPGRQRAAFAALAQPQRWALAAERLRAHRLLGDRGNLRERVAVLDRHLRGLVTHFPRRLADERTHTLLIRADHLATRNSGIGMGIDDTPPDSPDLGWSAHLAGPLEVAGLDADHYSLMRSPAIGAVARLIDAALARHL